MIVLDLLFSFQPSCMSLASVGPGLLLVLDLGWALVCCVVLPWSLSSAFVSPSMTSFFIFCVWVLRAVGAFSLFRLCTPFGLGLYGFVFVTFSFGTTQALLFPARLLFCVRLCGPPTAAAR